MRGALLLLFGLVAVTTPGASAGAERSPGASASAWAVRVVVAGAAGGSTTTVSSPPANGTASTNGFAWPTDGSVIAVGPTFALSTTRIAKNAFGNASSLARHVSIFAGEITADAVSASASAQTEGKAATGGFDGSGVTNLHAFGRPVRGDKITLGDWGYLSVDNRGVDTSAPAGAVGYRAFVTELDLHLNANHGGLPAGSEIQVGYAEAAAQTPPNSVKPVPLPLAPGNPLPGDRPQLLPKQTGPVIGIPQTVTPPISAGPYVFPVYGQSEFIDTYGAYRPDVSGNFHHGDDIFGQLGQPLLAVANGTLFSVGWNRVGGNRIWLRDAQGNEFYYAHLSAFSSLAVNGEHVKAGEVIGFMGDTGDAEGTPTHLHFEIHPVSLLYLGYDGAVDPTSYLKTWSHPATVPFPVVAGWTPTIPGTLAAPDPGAHPARALRYLVSGRARPRLVAAILSCQALLRGVPVARAEVARSVAPSADHVLDEAPRVAARDRVVEDPERNPCDQNRLVASAVAPLALEPVACLAEIFEAHPAPARGCRRRSRRASRASPHCGHGRRRAHHRVPSPFGRLSARHCEACRLSSPARRTV